MRGHILVVCLLVLAGCSSAPAGGPDPTTTVTPAPVPSPDGGDRGAPGPDGPGIEDGVVDGSDLGSLHADSLNGPHTRIVHFRVETGEGTLLVYQETRTVIGDESLLRRSYGGPLTDRFVPDSRNATTAREVRYDDGNVSSRRGFLDGERRGSEAPSLVTPVLVDDETTVADVLDGAVVDSRVQSLGYQVSTGDVDRSTAPGFLTDVRPGVARALVREDGRVTRLSVRYDARLGGRQVSVTQEVYWTRPVGRDLEREWADG